MIMKVEFRIINYKKSFDLIQELENLKKYHVFGQMNKNWIVFFLCFAVLNIFLSQPGRQQSWYSET
jgi:intracellular septation protein A